MRVVQLTRERAEEVYVLTLVMVCAVVVLAGGGFVVLDDIAREDAARALRIKRTQGNLLTNQGELANPRVSPPTHAEMANAAAHLCGVPTARFARLVARESSWRHWDSDGTVLRSSSGALGLAQVKLSTARDVSPTLDIYKPWDNLLAGACYLRQQYDRFGTWREALHAYHAGPNRKRTEQATRDYADGIL